eukprot:g6169.t1
MSSSDNGKNEQQKTVVLGSAEEHGKEEPLASEDNKEEVRDGTKVDVETKTRDFIKSVVDLAKTEAAQTKDELCVLEQMNNVAASEYAHIADTIASISSFKDELYKKHEILAKHIVEIDKIDKSTIELDHVVGILDEYTRRIEAKAQKFL